MYKFSFKHFACTFDKAFFCKLLLTLFNLFSFKPTLANL